MSHLTPDQLSAFLDDALPAPERAAAEAHLGECETCRTALEELRADDALFAETLQHDPGDAYFATFAARVADRIAAEGGREAAAATGEGAGEIEPDALADALPPARPARETSPWYDIGSWFRTPRRLAWVGGVAAVIVAAGVVMMIARETGVPELRDAKLVERATQSNAVRPVPPAAAPAQEAAPRSQAPAEAAPTNDADQARNEGTAARAATPARVRQMKQGAGEDVPVGTQQPLQTFAQEAAPAPPPPAPGESAYVRRDRRAQPLAGEPAGALRKDESAAPAQPKSLAAVPGREKSAAKTAAGTVESSGVASPQPAGGSCGTVVDARGRPVARAQVVIGTRGITATTADDGGFCFDLPAGDYDVTVFAVGFTPLRNTVSFGDPASPVRLTVRTVDVLPPPVQGAPPPSGAAPPPAFGVLPGAEVPYEPFPHDLPDSVRTSWQDAARVMSEAARNQSAPRFDEAAEAWNSIAAALNPGDARLRALEHRANARYSAWEIQPNGVRTAAAANALRELLAELPDGPRRDRALSQLGQVEP